MQTVHIAIAMTAWLLYFLSLDELSALVAGGLVSTAGVLSWSGDGSVNTTGSPREKPYEGLEREEPA